jgi:hypothetical protein
LFVLLPLYPSSVQRRDLLCRLESLLLEMLQLELL